MGKEAVYAREFHNGLQATFRDYIDGAKIHGSRYQPRGVEDHVYCADEKFWGATFIGIEDKWLGKLNAKKPHDLDKLLRPEQKKRLYKHNKFGAIGLQATFVKTQNGIWVVITRPMKGISNILPVDFARDDIDMAGPSEISACNCIIMKRKPGDRKKVKDRERYKFELCEFFEEIDGDLWLPDA